MTDTDEAVTRNGIDVANNISSVVIEMIDRFIGAGGYDHWRIGTARANPGQHRKPLQTKSLRR